MQRCISLKRQSRKLGFSLIELAMIMVIISIIVAVLLPNISSIMGRSKIIKVKADLTHISSVIKDFKARYGRWPVEMSQVSESIIPHDERYDSWGKPYSIWNYKLVCLDETGPTPIIRASSQFRYSRLYVVGFSGTTGYVLRTTDGGANFTTLLKKANIPFTNTYYNPQDIQSNNYICLRDNSTGSLYTFDTNTSKLIDTGIDGYSLATPKSIWMYDSNFKKVYKTLDGGKTRSISIDAPNFSGFFGWFLNYTVWKNNGTKEIRDINTGRFINNSAFDATGYIQSDKIYAWSGTGFYRLDNIGNPELTASWTSLKAANVFNAWVMNDSIVIEDTSLTFSISKDAGSTWVPWDIGSNSPIAGSKLVEMIKIDDEIWAIVLAGTWDIWYSPDSGTTWRDGPENPANPGQKFGVPAGLTQMKLFYTE